jgi:hypothetical protein
MGTLSLSEPFFRSGTIERTLAEFKLMAKAKKIFKLDFTK